MSPKAVAAATGVSTDTLRHYERLGLLPGVTRTEAGCQRVRSLVGERLNDLERRIEDLTALRADMHALLAEWDATLARTPHGQPARLLDMLTHRASLPGRTPRRVSRR